MTKASLDIDRMRNIVASEREKLRAKAAGGDFFSFIHYVNPRYRANWHHKELSRRLQRFYEDQKCNRLMIWMPPQHGKSEQASRLFPPFVHGMNPDCKIAACSYAADLARAFNRDVQRVMTSTVNYCEVFPGTRLGADRVANDSRGNTLRNTNEFQVIGRLGSYKSVGVGGGLSGRAVDMLIIDDPVKDAKEALSETVRESVWQWYQSVADTRLHNKSKVVIIMTRWHEDDLCGRLMDLEPEEWEVVKFPAVSEGEDIPGDPRKEKGMALWPERHSLERLLKKEAQSAWVFSALYQQRPSPIGGGIIKGDWFERVSADQLPNSPTHFYADTAFTEKQQNDPTAVMAYRVHGGKLYIVNVITVRMTTPDLLAFLPKYCQAAGYTSESFIRIEPKANGIAIVDTMQKNTDLNVIAASNPVGDKVVRVSAISPILQAGRVKVLDTKGAWLNEFIQECEAFPNAAHDDRVDCLEGAVREELVYGSIEAPQISNN